MRDNLRRKMNMNYKNSINQILEELYSIEKKLINKNDIYNFKNDIKLYLPFYPVDLIQKVIVNNGKFFEEDILISLDKKLKLNKESVILDIGANIGNNSIYWAIVDNVKKVYSFEPIKETFDILSKNIDLNNLQNKVIINNIGLADKDCLSSIKNSYSLSNIGGTSLKENNNGIFKLTTLDKYIDNDFKDNKIDFIKIDVEGFEYEVLLGAKETLQKYKPKIFIEIFENNIKKVNTLLEEYGYKKILNYPCSNYLYEYANKNTI